MDKRIEKNKEIIKEVEVDLVKEKSKKVIKIILYILIPLILIVTSIFLLLRYVGNIGIIVREYSIENSLITKDIDGLKIVHLSSIHYNKYTNNKDISSLIKMINKINPDIIVFTGDLIDKDYNLSKEEKEFLIKEFNTLKTSIGKYAIKGNEKISVKEIYDSSNFILLENINEKIYVGNSVINLFTINENYRKENIILNENSYTISLLHKPDLADNILTNFNSDLILAGNSLNGQIRLPFIGGLIRKKGSKKYIDEIYKFRNTTLYISGGIGNDGMPLRLFNHPSFNFYRLRTK